MLSFLVLYVKKMNALYCFPKFIMSNYIMHSVCIIIEHLRTVAVFLLRICSRVIGLTPSVTKMSEKCGINNDNNGELLYSAHTML